MPNDGGLDYRRYSELSPIDEDFQKIDHLWRKGAAGRLGRNL